MTRAIRLAPARHAPARLDDAPAGHATAAATRRIDVLASCASVDACRDALDALAADALECNAFYEHWMLRPAMAAFGSRGLRVVLVRDGDDAVLGCFPLLLTRSLSALGAPRLQLWRHPHCYVCTPLVAARGARATLSAFLDWLESPQAPARIVDLHELPMTGAFAVLLGDLLDGRAGWSRFTTSFERALLRPAAAATPAAKAHGHRDADDYGLAGRRRKDLRRLRRRLEARGAVAFRALAPGDDASPWIERFLALEASGWKGRSGSAMAARAQRRDFFVAIAREAHARARLSMCALELDGVPVAMQCNLRAGDGGYAFKIAFDERHADCSPGLQLECLAMHHLAHLEPPMAWLDSCAKPDHALMNRLWPDRVRIVRHVLSTGGVLSRLPVIWRGLARAWRHRLRAATAAAVDDQAI